MGKKKVNPSGLVQRGGTYYFRLDLPKDVRVILGQTAVWESLSTSDYDSAIAAWGPKHAEWKAKIEAARKGTLRYVDDDVAARMASTILQTPRNGLIGVFGSLEEIATRVREALPGLCKAVGITRWSDADETAVRDRLADQFIMALRAMGGDRHQVHVSAAIHTLADSIAVQDGQPVPALPQVKLLDAFDKWKSMGDARIKSAGDFKTSCLEFIAVNGDLPVTDLAEAHFLEYKDALYAMTNKKKGKNFGKPLSQNTRNKKMGGIKAVIRAAIRARIITVDPSANVTVPKGTKSKKRAHGIFDDEMKLFFASPVFTQGYRPQHVGEAAYWVPVLAYFTGARLSELCQLMVADVVTVNGVKCLRIVDGEGQHIKTESSHRLVPIAQKVIDLGFLKYHLATLNPKGKLFPAVKPDVTGNAGGLFSKWYSSYRKQIGMSREGADFHAIRHLAKTALRSVRGDGEAKLEITGHSSGTESSKYGQIPVKEMKSIVDQVEYDVVIPPWKPGKDPKKSQLRKAA